MSCPLTTDTAATVTMFELASANLACSILYRATFLRHRIMISTCLGRTSCRSTGQYDRRYVSLLIVILTSSLEILVYFVSCIILDRVVHLYQYVFFHPYHITVRVDIFKLRWQQSAKILHRLSLESTLDRNNSHSERTCSVPSVTSFI